MKKIITNSKFCAIMAVILYIVAAIDFIMAKDSGMPIVWLCLGTTWLCISVEYKNKHRNSDKDRKR